MSLLFGQGWLFAVSMKFHLFSFAFLAANNAYLIPIMAPLGVIMSAYFGWLIAKRTSSGSIQTSEAKDLWAGYGKLVTAGDKLREDLSNEVRSLRDENNTLRDQIIQQTEQLSNALTRIRELETQVREMQKGHK